MRPEQPDGEGHDVRHRRPALLAVAVAAVADLLDRPSDRVATDVPFDDLGLTSVQLARLTARLEDFLGTEVSPTVVYDHPDIDQLVEHLAMR